MEKQEINFCEHFRKKKYVENSVKRYILEVDADFFKELQKAHNDLPF